MTHDSVPLRPLEVFGGAMFTAGALGVGGLLSVPAVGWRLLPAAWLVAIILVVWSWRGTREALTSWQRAFARDVEYAARRQREAEAGLRFEAP